MGPAEIKFTRETFGLSQRDLAKALAIAPFTVARWETGENEPTGLQEEVLRALHMTAVRVEHRGDPKAASHIGDLIGLGIGALIFYLLNEDAPAAPKERRPHPPAVPASCPTCSAPITLTDQLIASLRVQPGRPIRELSMVLYRADTASNRSRVRALLSQLRRLGRVRHVGAGHWEVLASPTTALPVSSSTPRSPRTDTST